jgi:hypothetical protein
VICEVLEENPETVTRPCSGLSTLEYEAAKDLARRFYGEYGINMRAISRVLPTGVRDIVR